MDATLLPVMVQLRLADGTVHRTRVGEVRRDAAEVVVHLDGMGLSATGQEVRRVTSTLTPVPTLVPEAEQVAPPPAAASAPAAAPHRARVHVAPVPALPQRRAGASKPSAPTPVAPPAPSLAMDPAHRLESLLALAERSRRTLADPKKARWHTDVSAQLVSIEGEIERLKARTEEALSA